MIVPAIVAVKLLLRRQRVQRAVERGAGVMGRCDRIARRR